MTTNAVARWDQQHTFTVEGRGQFPFDMLRHSLAWPTSSDDANAMGAEGWRRVTLTGAYLRHIRPERWASFGWPVVDGFDEHGFPAELSVAA